MVAQVTTLLMLGAGGHATAVGAALGQSIDGFVGPGQTYTDDQALALDPSTVKLVNGIGYQGESKNVRALVYQRFRDAGFQFIGAVHQRAVVDPDALVATDAQVLIGAILVARSAIGANSIVNTGASVDHDSVVGAHSHICPGATICGGVTIGDGVFIGAGAVVLPGRTIGDRAVVGAGAVVTHDVAASTRVVGVPARELRGEHDA